MFMLENHLSTEQFRVVGQMREIAAQAGVNLFLTGGALRDTLGGFPVHDLEFTVEGNAPKLAKMVGQKSGVTVAAADDLRKSIELGFPGEVTAELTMAHQERFPKPGGRPQVTPATIHEDLRGRDFTVNAIALSLNRASLGLLIDPTNGMGDIERKELRAIHNYSFYDDPSRMLRLIRFKIRLGYTIDERTRLQYENAREAEMLGRISREALGAELRDIANEASIGDLMRALEEEKLIELYSPALAGPKLNLQNFSKLQKAHQLAPFGADLRINSMPLFLSVLLEKLTSRERSELIKAAALSKPEISAGQRLEGAAKKLERELKSSKLQKPSQLYELLVKAPGEQIFYLAVYSSERLASFLSNICNAWNSAGLS